MSLDIFYVPSNKMWFCNTWAEAYEIIMGFHDPVVERFNVVEYLSDGSTKFYSKDELYYIIHDIEQRISLRTAVEADLVVHVPAWPGSPPRKDLELAERGKRNRL